MQRNFRGHHLHTQTHSCPVPTHTWAGNFRCPGKLTRESFPSTSTLPSEFLVWGCVLLGHKKLSVGGPGNQAGHLSSTWEGSGSKQPLGQGFRSWWCPQWPLYYKFYQLHVLCSYNPPAELGMGGTPHSLYLVLEILASGAFTQMNMELAIPLQADCAAVSKQWVQLVRILGRKGEEWVVSKVHTKQIIGKHN